MITLLRAPRCPHLPIPSSYLTQLSDQIISPVSKEQAELFVWDSGSHNPEASAQEDDVYGDDDDDDERMFTFEVQKSEDQEENVTAKPGFKVSLND